MIHIISCVSDIKTNTYHSLFLNLLSSGKRVGYNNMIYREDEIERIARVAGELPYSKR